MDQRQVHIRLCFFLGSSETLCNNVQSHAARWSRHFTCLTSLVCTVKEVKTPGSKPLYDWEVYSGTLKEIEDGNGSHQEQAVQRLDEGKAYFVSHCPDLCKRVSDYVMSRLQWTDFQLIKDIIFVLATQSWEKILTEATMVLSRIYWHHLRDWVLDSKRLQGQQLKA